MAGRFGTELVPEHPDTGCAAGGPSCLSCWLPRCIHDERTESHRPTTEQQRQRDAEALQLWDGGMLITVIAKQMRIGHATVRRAIERRAQGD